MQRRIHRGVWRGAATLQYSTLASLLVLCYSQGIRAWFLKVELFSLDLSSNVFEELESSIQKLLVLIINIVWMK